MVHNHNRFYWLLFLVLLRNVYRCPFCNLCQVQESKLYLCGHYMHLACLKGLYFLLIKFILQASFTFFFLSIFVKYRFKRGDLELCYVCLGQLHATLFQLVPNLQEIYSKKSRKLMHVYMCVLVALYFRIRKCDPDQCLISLQ